MLRKIVSTLILLPLAVIVVALAVANRQTVVISLDPFDPAHPAFAMPIPMFALMLGLVIVGVIVGGIAAWLRQSKWRRAARVAEAHARDLQAEVEEFRAQDLAGAFGSVGSGHPTQLTIPPPAA